MKGLKKHKKLIITLSIVLGVILVGVILNFTLFTLKDVSIDFKNKPTVFTEESKESIANNSAIKKGSSIFSLSKKNITTQLEKDYPYLKIINIETVFPNKIIVHCAEREEAYAVKVSDTRYFICDSEFKVLANKLVSVSRPYKSEQDNAILFTGLENIITNINRVNIGEFLEFSSEENILNSIGKSFLKTNKSVSMQKGLIKSIEFTSGIYPLTSTNMPYLIIEDFNGFKTNVYKLETLLAEKFQYMFATISEVVYNPQVFFKDELTNGTLLLENIPVDYYLDYTLQIRENLKGQILIRLEKNS